MKTKQTASNVVQLSPKKKNGRRVEDKWTPQIAKFGYTSFPNLLLFAQAKLKITPMQFNVLAHIFQHWWDADRDPYPAKDTIARRMRRTPRQIQRYLTELENLGLVERKSRYSGQGRQINNAYSFNGLIKKLKVLEPEFTKEQEQKRLRRKKLETAAAG